MGNPGVDYERTRHNVGFLVLDRLASGLGVRFGVAAELSRRAWTAEAELDGGRLLLAKPRTYMNRSGRAAGAICRHYGASPADFLVVCDDADLELGRLRLRGEGRPGGHNGLRSLIDVFGTDVFARVKLGVRGERRSGQELADYVLAPFDTAEEEVIDRLLDVTVESIRGFLAEGLTWAMNRYNGVRLAPPEDGPTERQRSSDRSEESG